MLQRTYTHIIWIFFVPMVMIGAFFLLNLTLAVINSKFTEAHNEQQKANIEALKENQSMTIIDNELDEAVNKKDEMSIAQFITARIYAKKMIEFLRMRQEIKRIDKERLDDLKNKQQKKNSEKRNIPSVKSDS